MPNITKLKLQDDIEYTLGPDLLASNIPINDTYNLTNNASTNIQNLIDTIANKVKNELQVSCKSYSTNNNETKLVVTLHEQLYSGATILVLGRRNPAITTAFLFTSYRSGANNDTFNHTIVPLDGVEYTVNRSSATYTITSSNIGVYSNYIILSYDLDSMDISFQA